MNLLFWFRKTARPEIGKINLRITINGKRAEFCTGIKVTSDEWDGDGGRFVGGSDRIRLYRRKIQNIEERAIEANEMLFRESKPSTSEIIRKVLESLRSRYNKEGEEISPERFQIELKNKDLHAAVASVTPPDLTLLHAICIYVAKKKLSDARKDLFAYFFNYTHDYLRSINALSMPAVKFSKGKAADLNEFLELKGLGVAYRGEILGGLKCVTAYCESRELIAIDPIVSFQVERSRSYDTTHLKEKDIKKLRALSFSEKPMYRMALDTFFILIRTSMHFGDFQELRAEHIQIVEGVKCLIKPRQKTGIEYLQVLHPEVEQILEQYGGPEGLIFNKNGEYRFGGHDHFNYYLREIGKEAGIAIKFTSKTGRKTFANDHLNNLDYDKLTVATEMGLKRIDTLDYYGRAGLQRVMAVVNNRTKPLTS